jgi:hypothetical protein
MNKDTILSSAVVGGIFLLSLALVIYADEHDEKQAVIAKQLAYEKWSQNNLFMNTLERYNEIYFKLNSQHEKEALAVAYVEMLTQDLFLFPSKRAKQTTLNILLPSVRKVEGKLIDHKPYVLQEIHIGSDNGMYEALKYLMRGHRSGINEPPPFILSQTGYLLEYIKTGNQGVLHSVKTVP